MEKFNSDWRVISEAFSYFNFMGHACVSEFEFVSISVKLTSFAVYRERNSEGQEVSSRPISSS